MSARDVASVVRDAMSGKKKETVNLGQKGSITIKKGAMTAAAKREGVSNAQYEQEHKNDSGLAGKRARLALTMKSWNHSK